MLILLILKERLSKLEGGIAILRVGGYTEVELKEKRDRVDDALAATQAAVAEGILPGGGTMLYRIGTTLDFSSKEDMTSTEKIGAKILLDSCKAPFETILSNAGLNSEVIAKDLDISNLNHGYNSRAGKFCDMIESGIIDPAKVTRSAIENAASISGLMLTTECVLMEQPSQPEVDAK
jgi:chaperonin GroEL